MEEKERKEKAAKKLLKKARKEGNKIEQLQSEEKGESKTSRKRDAKA